MNHLEPRELAIEPARPEDGPHAARLLIETDPELYRFLYGADREATESLLAAQWARHDCLSSHALALVIRAGERPLGLILSYTAEQFQLLPQFVPADGTDTPPGVMSERVAAALRNRASPAVQDAGFLFPVVPPGNLYIQNLAIVSEARGCGLGRRLLAEVFAKATTQGFAACHLDVAATNSAVGFYRSQGMEVLIETRMPGLAEQHGLPTHYRMIKRFPVAGGSLDRTR